MLAVALKFATYITALAAMAGAVVFASISPVIVAATISAIGTIVASLLACLNVYISSRILNQARTNHDATMQARDTARESMDHLVSLADSHATDATDATGGEVG